ncbi:MAG: NAD-dependent epimerase/dehydratase family protein [Gammaproteobacteria bacterium]
MRILVTGGAGCLGSNCVEHWLPQGHEILVIDNFATGKREVLSASVPGLTLVEGSVADWALVRRCFAEMRPDVVIHSAASYKDPTDWAEDAATNVMGSINVARAAELLQVSRLVNFQTALCYGRPARIPIAIDHPLAPFTSYGISKVAGEQYLLLANIPVMSLRIANVTGPRLAIGPIPTFYKRLKAGQRCFCSDTTRDFLDMSDFLALMDRLLEDKVPAGSYNVSSGEGHTIGEVFEEVAAYLGIALGAPVPVVPAGPDDVPVVVLDPCVTEAKLGWKARIGFRDTLRRQLEWYDRHGVSDVHSHLAAAKA